VICNDALVDHNGSGIAAEKPVFSLPTLVGSTDERGKTLGNTALVTFLSDAVCRANIYNPFDPH
jgi:hypothetical protein